MAGPGPEADHQPHWALLTVAAAGIWGCAVVCLWGGIASVIAGVGGLAGSRVDLWWAVVALPLGVVGLAVRAWSELSDSERAPVVLVGTAILLTAWVGAGALAGAFG